MKSQVNAAMAQQLTQNESLKDNPFAVRGYAFAAKMVDSMVDVIVTPAGWSALITEGNTRAEPATPSHVTHTDAAAKRVNWDAAKSKGFTGLTEFTVEQEDENSHAPIYMIWELQGLSWRLMDIDTQAALSNSTRQVSTQNP